MKKRKKEKGSILLMSAVLLAVVMLIGTMIIVVFFRGYVNVSREIKYTKDRLDAQVLAQEYYSSLNKEEINSGNYPADLTFNSLTNTYSYCVETEKFTVTVTLNSDLEIEKWHVKE